MIHNGSNLIFLGFTTKFCNSYRRKEIENMSKPIAIQVYSVRDAAEVDLDATLKALKEFGYDGVELAGLYGNTPETVRDLCKKHGLCPISAHVSYKEMMADPDKLFADYATIGCKYVAIPSLPTDRIPGGEKFDETAELIKTFSTAAKKNGIQLLYHNHDFEFEKHEGKYLHDYIFDEVGDLIDPELDTCWVHYAGINPADKIREFAGRVEIVHLKDFVCKELGGGPAYDLIDNSGKGLGKKSREDNGFQFRPLGTGRQNFLEILEACEASGTEYVIVEQDQTYDIPELEAAKISRDYLRETFGL